MRKVFKIIALINAIVLLTACSNTIEAKSGPELETKTAVTTAEYEVISFTSQTDASSKFDYSPASRLMAIVNINNKVTTVPAEGVEIKDGTDCLLVEETRYANKRTQYRAKAFVACTKTE